MTIVTEIDITKTWSGLPAPNGWHIVNGIYRTFEPGHPRCGHKWEPLFGKRFTIMEDVSVKADGKRWLHVSVGYPNDKMPSYEDMQLARKLFIGEHREAYQIFPPKERYVNAHNVLHWWCCLDEPLGLLPHFEAVVSGILTV
jgi:hypothetical protein